MANKTLDIVIKVQSQKADNKLKNTKRRIKETGDATKKLNLNFKDFNRTLFATTAFIGIFQKAFSAVGQTLKFGAEIDRLTTQFERAFGSRGKFLQTLRNMTDTSIDMMTAMKEGISLKNLGIVQDQEQLAMLMAKSGTAAKLAGMDSAAGISKFSEFLKTGNISSLRFLNLISESNTGLMAQMAILSKAGGTMGRVLNMQHRQRLAMQLLNAATRGNLKGNRDLTDVLHDLGQTFNFLRGEAGILLGKALAPIIDKVTLATEGFTELLRSARENKKGFVFFIKSMSLAAAGAAALAATLGTLRLSVMMLNSLGVGLPGLLANVLLLGTGFLSITSGVDGLVNKLELFGNFIKGIYQLVSSLNTETGIAQLDKDLKEALERAGLLEFTQNIARVVSIVKTAVTDTYEGFVWLSGIIDDTFGGMGRKVIDAISAIKGPWSNFWVNDAISPIKKFARAAGTIVATVLAGLGLSKLSKGLGGMISKIPIIGKLLGGKVGHSASNPMFVSVVNSLLPASATPIKNPKELFSKLKTILVSKGKVLMGALQAALVSGVPALLFAVKGALLAASAVLGYKLGEYLDQKFGINKLINEKTTETTEEGYTGNVLHRLGFGVEKFLETENYKNFIKSKQAETTMPTGLTTIPEYTTNEATQEGLLEGTLLALRKDKREQMQAAITNATSEDSAGGKYITREEWVEIFRYALDSSVNLTDIKDKTKESAEDTSKYNTPRRSTSGRMY